MPYSLELLLIALVSMLIAYLSADWETRLSGSFLCFFFLYHFFRELFYQLTKDK